MRHAFFKQHSLSGTMVRRVTVWISDRFVAHDHTVARGWAGAVARHVRDTSRSFVDAHQVAGARGVGRGVVEHQGDHGPVRVPGHRFGIDLLRRQSFARL